MLKRPDPPTMEPPFTPDLVYELLREVLKERRLGQKDPAITHLARALNIMRYEVRSDRGVERGAATAQEDRRGDRDPD